jgi:hypothetical protein
MVVFERIPYNGYLGKDPVIYHREQGLNDAFLIFKT